MADRQRRARPRRLEPGRRPQDAGARTDRGAARAGPRGHPGLRRRRHSAAATTTALRQAGVAAVFGPGSPIPACAQEILDAGSRTRVTAGETRCGGSIRLALAAARLDCRRRYLDGVLRGRPRRPGPRHYARREHRAGDAEPAPRLLDALLPHTGKARRVGITGVPGVGKSTFIDALGMHLVRERGERVAVLSVDPSSPFSGGSILGDKTRMERLAVDRAPSSGRRRRAATSAAWPAHARGDPPVRSGRLRQRAVETVGVGQSEIAVRDDRLLPVAAARRRGRRTAGDQAGHLEMADVLAVTKADGDNGGRPRARGPSTPARIHLFPTARTSGRRRC